MVLFTLMLAMSATGAEPGFDVRMPLAGWGDDPARGVLVNRTLGARPGDPIDPARPTLVVVHGWNPFHPLVHFQLAERYGEALGACYGSTVNVLGWDWNGDTMSRPSPQANREHAVVHGRRLALALEAAGVDPRQLHLIGQSSGAIVAASTARTLADRGRTPARLTLLDPATVYHDLVFGRLQAGMAAGTVENVWATGLTGYGDLAPYAGVINLRLEGIRGIVGVLRPMHSDHLDTVRWHIGLLGR